MNSAVRKCISCGKCTRECVFLQKYNINLQAYAMRADLAHHCFLCGKCKTVCPVDIDGRELSLNLRKQAIFNGYIPKKEGFALLIHEKQDYQFKNYKNAGSGTALFPGCNFPAYYPKTMHKLLQIFEKRGIGIIFDCCGKPIADLGMVAEEQCAYDSLNARLRRYAIKELIVLCPNCYYHLRKRLDVKITSIYEKLGQWDKVDLSDGVLHMPCPDKASKELLISASAYIDKPTKHITTIQCCGAGGCAMMKEPMLAANLYHAFSKQNISGIYTYCATCSGMIHKAGTPTQHILCKIVGTDEIPDKGFKTILNKMKFKWIRSKST